MINGKIRKASQWPVTSQMSGYKNDIRSPAACSDVYTVPALNNAMIVYKAKISGQFKCEKRIHRFGIKTFLCLSCAMAEM